MKTTNMYWIRFWIFIVLVDFSINSLFGGDTLTIYRGVRRSGQTNTWSLRLDNMPQTRKWDPETQKLPLSIDVAVGIARKWCEIKTESQTLTLNSASLLSADPEGGRYHDVFYYRIIFNVSPFERIACIVLLDGKIHEPDSIQL